MKFVEWPADAMPEQAAITLCVVDDDPLATALGEAVAGKAVRNRALQVRSLRIGDDARACHVVDFGGMEAGSAERAILSLKGRAVLTVGDGDAFTARGGAIGLFLDGNHMRFGVNVSAVQRANLQMSSKLLSLAKRKDE